MLEPDIDHFRAKLPALSDASLSVVERMEVAIRLVYDPEIPINIFDLGLIYGLEYAVDEQVATVVMTLTSPNCPAADEIMGNVQMMVKQIPEVQTIRIKLTWDPPWTFAQLSEAAQLDLGFI